jgi:hypothetical protein
LEVIYGWEMRDAGSQAIGYDLSSLYRSAQCAVGKYHSVQQVALAIVLEKRLRAELLA